MPFIFEKLKIPDVILVKPKRYSDKRGMFMETYKYSTFKEHGIDCDFVQDNHSVSEKNVLRGLHFQQNPKMQGKLVRVIHGEIFDVAVDIRKKSNTYGEWVSMKLSGDNGEMLFIPPGFAHGFCVLSEQAVVHYKTTEEYAPQYEDGIYWNDKSLDIKWPVSKPIVSEKDRAYNSFERIKIK